MEDHEITGYSNESLDKEITWQQAALRYGEDLASVGPNGYYDFTPEQWLNYALKIKMTEWIKCTTELPDRDDTFLTCVMDDDCKYSLKMQRFSKKYSPLQGPYGDKRSHWEIETWDDYITTHWMELPEFPNLK